MPRISAFYGIVVYMYYFDDARHAVPHIHAMYQGKEAIYSIIDGTRLAGDIPRTKAMLIQAWIEIHRAELTANWNLAVRGQVLRRVAPLR